MRTMGRFLLFLLAWTAVSSSKTSEFRSVPEAFEVVEAIKVVIATVMGNSATIDAQTMLLLDGLSKYASRLLSLASTGADTYEGIVDSLSRLRTRYEVRRADLDNAILNAGYAAESHFKFVLFNPPSSSDGNWLSYLGVTQDIYTRIFGAAYTAPTVIRCDPCGRLLPAAPPTRAAAASRLWKPVPSDDGIEQRCRGRGGVGR